MSSASPNSSYLSIDSRDLNLPMADATGMSLNSPNFAMTLDEYADSKPDLMRGLRTQKNRRIIRKRTPNRNMNAVKGKRFYQSPFAAKKSFKSSSITRDPMNWKRDKFQIIMKRTIPNKTFNSSVRPTMRDRNPQQIVINNLSTNVDDQILKKIMSSCQGFLKCGIHLSSSGKHLGFGDATFTTKPNALKAIKYLQNKKINGRPIDVTLMTPQSNADVSRNTSKKFTLERKQDNIIIRQKPRNIFEVQRRRSAINDFKRITKSKLNQIKKSPKTKILKTQLSSRPVFRKKSQTLTVEDLDKELELYNRQ